MKIVLIIGARPNFMKAFPVYEALKHHFELTLIHTGQHFDEKMSDIFFNQLKFPKPDIQLNLESKTKAGIYDDKLYINNENLFENKDRIIQELINHESEMGQLGEIRDKLYNEFLNIDPDLVIVFGDVTSTLAAGLAANKLKIKLAHVESGLRSFDIKMPEEVNRILTDHITDYYFVTEPSGVEHLKKDGIFKNVFLVGNTMIDTQKKYLQQALDTKYHKVLGLEEKKYVLITLHRPSNVDDLDNLKSIFDDLLKLSETKKLVYPIHPRTKNNLIKINYLDKIIGSDNIILTEPLGYLEFTCLMVNCCYVITDSGGLQEESTALNIPCFTLRKNTERPSTLIENNGTNQLINKISKIEFKKCKGYNQLWDGESSKKIYKIISNKINLLTNIYGFKTKYLGKLEEIEYNCSIHYRYKFIDFLFKNKNNNNLLITFHGAKKLNTALPIFRLYNKNIENYDICSFSDPLFRLNSNINLGWFLNTKKINTFDIIKDIVNEIKKKYKNIVFFGSSGAGLISLILGSYFNEIVLITNSQIYLEKYFYYKTLINYIPNIINYDIEDFYIKNGPPKHLCVYQNVDDTHHYHEHFLPFCNFFKKNFETNLITENIFKRNDIDNISDHHGKGQFPINSCLEKELEEIFLLKIIIVQNNINIGGAQKYGIEIAKCFNTENVTFLTHDKVSDEKIKDIKNYININNLQVIQCPYEKISSLNETYDICFLNSYPMIFLKPFELFLKTLKTKTKKLNVILHNETNRFTLNINQLKKQNYIDNVICVFDRLKEKIINESGHNSICIYPSINLEKQVKTNKNHNPKILGFYGRILPCKGVKLLIMYWKDLHIKFPNWKLKLVGNYTKFSLKYYQEIIQYINYYDLHDAIILDIRDVIGDKEKQEVFSSFDIFIQLSLYEGLPYTIIESLSYNVPVIHTNVGGVKEILNNRNGYILNFEGLYYDKFYMIDYEKEITNNLYNKYYETNNKIFEECLYKMFTNYDDKTCEINSNFDFKTFSNKIRNL